MAITVLLTACAQSLQRPPEFNGSSTSSSFRVRLEQSIALRGFAREDSWQELAFEAPARIHFTSSGHYDWPLEAIVVGDSVWAALGARRDIDASSLRAAIGMIKDAETALSYRREQKATAGPNFAAAAHLAGEPTLRYRWSNDDPLDGLREADPGRATPGPEAPPLGANFVRDLAGWTSDVRSVTEVLVGVQTGRIFSVRVEFQGTYMTGHLLLTVRDFGLPFGIEPPSGAPLARP